MNWAVVRESLKSLDSCAREPEGLGQLGSGT
jgi:hypothetical protein